jgi:hypothetical protein
MSAHFFMRFQYRKSLFLRINHLTKIFVRYKIYLDNKIKYNMR